MAKDKIIDPVLRGEQNKTLGPIWSQFDDCIVPMPTPHGGNTEAGSPLTDGPPPTKGVMGDGQFTTLDGQGGGKVNFVPIVGGGSAAVGGTKKNKY